MKWNRFAYRFWRSVGAVAFSAFHFSQTMAHGAYVRGGRHGRRVQQRKPLTAIWKWWQSVKTR